MKFGQYELLEPIAVGGMAEVFKGRVVGAEGFEKLVAIKRILPDLAEDERFVKMLLTEARIHSALSHRNIVQIHDLGISEEGEYFIVLEYVEGYDLRVITEQINGGGEIIPEALSLHIAAEIAQGLHFAHELRGPDGQPLGLVHRDVTPSNVLISFAGEVKLSDFGLAKRRHDRSVVGSLKGNLAYMSPEQATPGARSIAAPTSSRWAPMLFELLTGRRLREITDEVAGWSQVASGVVPSARAGAPRSARRRSSALLDRALAADPAARFPDAATFGAAIRDVLARDERPRRRERSARRCSASSRRRASARALMMERSKVIRLGPEAEALRRRSRRPRRRRRCRLCGETVHLADPGPTPTPNRNFTPARTPVRYADAPADAGARTDARGHRRALRCSRPADTGAHAHAATKRRDWPAVTRQRGHRHAPPSAARARSGRDATAQHAAAARAPPRRHAPPPGRSGADPARHAVPADGRRPARRQPCMRAALHPVARRQARDRPARARQLAE